MLQYLKSGIALALVGFCLITFQAGADEKKEAEAAIRALKQMPSALPAETKAHGSLMEQIEKVGAYRFQETMDALVDRLDSEVDLLLQRFKPESAFSNTNWFEVVQPGVVNHILTTLRKNGSSVQVDRARVAVKRLDTVGATYPIFKKNLEILLLNLDAETTKNASLPQLSVRGDGPALSHNILAEIKTFAELPTDLTPGTEKYEAVMDIATHLSNFEYYEPTDALVERLDLEVQAMKNRYDKLKAKNSLNWETEIHADVVLHLLGLLKRYATTNHLNRVRKTLMPLEYIYRASDSFHKRMMAAFLMLEAVAEKRTTPLGSIHEVIAELAPGTGSLPTSTFTDRNTELTSSFNLASRMKSAREGVTNYLKRRIVGQDAIIELFANIEENNVIFPDREVPAKMILMGQPGLGKDSIVEYYVDYLNAAPGAWRTRLHKAPVMKEQADLWRFLGSNSGFVDSDNIPPLITFLVNSSDGRYRLETREDGMGRIKWKILENSTADLMQSARNNPNMTKPSKAVIFFNEFHNWTQEMKDAIKIAMEKGEWTINNPGGGLEKIHVPVTMIFATNEGVGLVSSMEASGERFGDPLPSAKQQEKWAAVYQDRDRLVQELMKSNSRKSNSNSALGYSREWLNKFEGSPIGLLRPFGPSDLQLIANMSLALLSDDYRYKSDASQMELVASPELGVFLQEYNYRSEEMARPVIGNVQQMIKITVNRALRDDLIPLNEGRVKVVLTPVRNANLTTDLEFTVLSDRTGKEIKRFQLLIEATLADKEKELMSPERIEHLLTLKDYLNKNVFGLNPILVDGIANSILLAEESKNGRVKKNEAPKTGASIFGLFGKSSTGKTETIKVVNNFLYQNKTPITIDFSQVQNVTDIKEMILGTVDHTGKAIHSKFMKHYDRNNGEVLIAFDEIANAPAWALKALYDILREPVVTTFSDGEKRPMNKVMIIPTGNIGEKWYQGIPKDIPEWMQMYAQQEIYKQAMNNPGLRRMALEEYFSEAFINRVNEQNIYFFGPLTFKSLRELVQLKMELLLNELKPQEGRYGWDLRFESLEAFYDIVKLVEENGFVLAEQGASIESFINKMLSKELRVLLLKNKVRSGSTVVISRLKSKETISDDGDEKRPNLVIGLKTENAQLELKIQGRPLDEAELFRDEDRYLTALHEAGHSVAGKVLFKGVNEQNKVSTIPGVTMINGKFVAYAGIATSKDAREMRITPEWVLRRMAVLAAGETAQRLATKGHVHDSGKGNDMERATDLALRSILKWGLNDRWGTATVPPEMTMNEYIASLSQARRDLLNEEVEKMMKAARDLATSTIAANMENAVIPLGIALAEKGVLEGEEFKNKMASLTFHYDVMGRFKLTPDAVKKWIVGQPGVRSVDAELVDYLPRPKTIAKYEDIIAKDRAREQALVPKPERLPLAQASLNDALISSRMKVCDGVLGGSQQTN